MITSLIETASGAPLITSLSAFDNASHSQPIGAPLLILVAVKATELLGVCL
jgi:hypothetical protein